MSSSTMAWDLLIAAYSDSSSRRRAEFFGQFSPPNSVLMAPIRRSYDLNRRSRSIGAPGESLSQKAVAGALAKAGVHECRVRACLDGFIKQNMGSGIRSGATRR